MDDDDYWNTSETKSKAFSFDDDVDRQSDAPLSHITNPYFQLSPQEILAIGQKSCPGQAVDGVFSTVNNAKNTLLPLSSLVSPKVLDLIVLAQSGKDPNNVVEPQQIVDVTLKRIILGRSFSLHTYKSLKSKTELLDGAISIGDGNAVLIVVLFLIQTLNKKLAHELLCARPLALNHYISFLQTEGKVTELTDLFTMLGRNSEAAICQFQHIVKTQGNSVDGLLRKLNNLLSNHFNQPGMDTHQNKMVADYVKLLEWQKCTNKAELHNKPSLLCLLHCVSNHWNEGAGNMMSPLTLCQRQQVTPLQYDWVVLNVHANSNKWDIVESLFTKKGWLGRTTVSSHIPIEALLCRLSELKASSQLLATCLNKVPGTEDRLRLAQKHKVHSVVIETFAKQKDRTSLTNYKMTLNPQSEEYMLAENTLRDSICQFQHIVKTQGNSVDGLLRKLNNLLSNHFNQPGMDTHQNKMVADYVKLLEWQKCTNKAELHNKPSLLCLLHCVSNHWNEGAGNMMSPLTLCQRQQVTPLQYDWVVLNVHANSNKWDIVESLFTKKGWLGRTTVSSHIPIEALLCRLSELKASSQLLATCLNKVPGTEDRLRLAQKHKVHSVVIETFAKQKDRTSLTNYKMTLNPQSEEYMLAENTLRDSSIKWKN